MTAINSLLCCLLIQGHGGLVVFLLFPVHLETNFLSHMLLLTQKFRLFKTISRITHLSDWPFAISVLLYILCLLIFPLVATVVA